MDLFYPHSSTSSIASSKLHLQDLLRVGKDTVGPLLSIPHTNTAFTHSLSTL